ncbi:MAG: hypothetical protein KC423_01555 [Anaerolineales bacterium]|nr:hypothetical protein [Anaerolineales bacterium]
MSTAYQLTKEQNDIVLRFPQQLLDEQMLSDLLDYLELSAIRRKSHLTDQDVNQLATEIKQGAWQQVKYLFTE